VRIRQWFWRASFSERYRVGGESFITNDLRDIYKFLTEEKADPAYIAEAPNPTRLAESLFQIRNSRARAFILALAMRSPRNLTNGALIDTAAALSSFNKKEFHHVFPRAYLKRTGETLENNSIVNICMLAASENKVISDEDPHIYLPRCIKNLGSDSEAVFASNLLPLPSAFNYAKRSYTEFFKARSKIIGEFASKLCDGEIH
jgi:hypothetical protein